MLFICFYGWFPWRITRVQAIGGDALFSDYLSTKTDSKDEISGDLYLLHNSSTSHAQLHNSRFGNS